MATWVALLRGINVGGNQVVKMAQLKRVFESEGCTQVRSYIQSGNVVFESKLKSKSVLVQRLSDAIELAFGFRPPLLVLAAAELLTALKQNPFPDAHVEASKLHFFFLYSRPSAIDEAGLAMLKGETEAYQLVGNVFYLHTPQGVSKSKLAGVVDRKLGVTVTARNLATVKKLAALIKEIAT